MKFKIISYLTSFFILVSGNAILPVIITPSPAQAQTTQDKNNEAVRLYEEANKQYEQGQYQQALETFQKALIIVKEINERYGETLIYNKLGIIYQNLGDYPQSLKYFQQALPITKELGEQAGEASIINNIGRVYHLQSQYSLALEYYEKGLVIRKKIGDKIGEGSSLNNIASIYDQLGEYQQALEYYQQSLDLAKQTNDNIGTSITLDNIAMIYNNLGQYSLALEYNQKALKLVQPLQNKIEEARTLNNAGLIYNNLGQYQKSVNYYEQSLAIRRQIKDKAGEATSLNNIGNIYSNIRKYEQALDYYQQALALNQAIGSKAEEGITLNNIGTIYDYLNQPEKALKYYQQALAIHQQTGNKQIEATTLGNIAKVYSNIGQNSQAIEYYQQALKIIRQVGKKAGEATILSNLGSYYLKTGNLPEAETNLLASIEIFDTLRPGLKDEDKVSLFDLQIANYLALQKTLISQNKPEKALEIAERSRARAFVELLGSKLNETSNKTSNIKPLNIPEIKQIAKQKNATLIEYSIIDITSEGKPLVEPIIYIWVIKPSGEITFRSVPLDTLKTTLKDFIIKGRQSIGIRGQNGENYVENSREDIYQPLQELHQLLIEPIADLLPTNPQEKVIFIPHEALFLVPFAALQDKQGKYLIEKITILTSPSIQTLELTHQQSQNQTKDGEVLIIGNPTMPYISSEPGETPYQLSNLPGAEIEANTIATLFNTKAIIGNAATKENLLPRMEKARIIHFATHGLFDDIRGLDSAIALTPTSTHNGLFTAEQILDLKLQTELVVLSACDTGRGKITGDGVIGLSRSLISAGSSSVLVSLWQVPDLPTAFLMQEFYQNLQKNPDKADALRQAMLTTKKKYPKPRDWAGFTLIGES
ncbi:MAG TPA: tetratricopeptide repeat protein [Halomicronema sp.]